MNLYANLHRFAHRPAEAAETSSCDAKFKKCAGAQRKLSDAEFWSVLEFFCRTAFRAMNITGLFTWDHVGQFLQNFTDFRVSNKTLRRCFERHCLCPNAPYLLVLARLCGQELAQATKKLIEAYQGDRNAKQVFLHRRVIYFDGTRVRHVVDLPPEELARLNSRSKLIYHYTFVSPKNGRSCFFQTTTKDQKKRESELMRAVFSHYAGTQRLLLMPIAPIGSLAKAGVFDAKAQLELYGQCSKQNMTLIVHPLPCINFDDERLKQSELWKSVWPFDENFPLSNRKKAKS